MKQVLDKLHEINEYLLKNAKEEHELGLLHGKLGLSIYFYHLAKRHENHEFHEVADSMLGEIFEKLSEDKLDFDFETGLAGIAYGISYLVNSDFVDADLDDTLGELDDRIYKYLEDQKTNLPANLQNGVIGYLFYCLNRLENSLKSKHQSNIYIFQKLAAGLLNQLGHLVEEEKLQDRDPQLFSIFWDLPLVLILLAESKKLNVNPAKSERILDYLIPSIISLFPKLHSNRLYLLLGIELVLIRIESADLRNHALFLKSTIDLEKVFNSDCKNLNINFQDGVCGLRLICEKLAEISGDYSFLPPDELIFRKINESVCWGEADYYISFKRSIGLVSGLCGIGLTLLESVFCLPEVEEGGNFDDEKVC